MTERIIDCRGLIKQILFRRVRVATIELVPETTYLAEVNVRIVLQRYPSQVLEGMQLRGRKQPGESVQYLSFHGVMDDHVPSQTGEGRVKRVAVVMTRRPSEVRHSSSKPSPLLKHLRN